jgi:uncharacterized protein
MNKFPASPPVPPGIFLSARWENLILANYAVDPALLAPYLPAGTELDPWQGGHLVSLVGFQFLQTRVLGLAIPFHVNFVEFNLRFYVRRRVGEEWRRGVVFIKELVPRAAIAFVARVIYREPYSVRRMGYTLERTPEGIDCRYTFGADWIGVRADPQPLPIEPGSAAEFITEHYFGYNRYSAQRTLEYGVEHPRWRQFAVRSFDLRCDVARLYGGAWRETLEAEPASAIFAEGSAVVVRRGVCI